MAVDYRELQKMDYDTLRSRMNEGSPESDHWVAYKAELELRNIERATAASEGMARSVATVEATVHDVSRLTQDLLGAVQHLNVLTRRVEIATYVVLAASLIIAADVVLRALHL